MMGKYRYIRLTEEPVLKDEAASWFHHKWGVPEEEYITCMCGIYGRRLPL